ncbi:MAG: NAD(P)H-dependent oxidoreductase [Helicobacteraceae bacterium]|jgi:multimeric flavodoxin WrbA|nr:NAD(P)H-dependent oxidoreductase [Helicobacteraceae bacterium]
MDVLICDIKSPNAIIAPKIDRDNTIVISDNGKIRPCIGCFGCWIKTPAECVINDGYNNMGELISKCDKVIIASRCYYGGYSPFIHNVLDRSISYISPYFEVKNGEMHHKQRYDNHIILAAHLYGKTSEQERETARKLVSANGVNLFARQTEIYFYDEIQDLLEALQ